MGYTLLTGATGLLGNYVLRNLLLAGAPVAVLVRGSRRQTPRQRIELAMADWEQQLGRVLPRPVVLEGDICQPDLGLDAVSMRWVAEHCDAVISNAASLTFHATTQESEPYRSNVGGTTNVLELCKNLRIRKLYHVSTAYIAGQRQGKILESDVDVGQTPSNDYEASKLQSEMMVRAADFLDTPTVFRPGIIIGDTKTGFTTTYHGFYAALQLCHTICKTMSVNETGRIWAQEVRLALDGNETKNLVPVDWVADVMSHVILHPELHGQTYHLTPEHPVTMRQIRDVLEETNRFYGTRFAGTGECMEQMSEAEAIFYEHIRVYNSYWKNDPEFDRTNTVSAAPHLPCPHIDRRLLAEMSQIVIDAGFPTPSKKAHEIEFDPQRHLQPLLENAAELATHETTSNQLVGLDLIGPGGGQWQFFVQQGQVLGAEMGLHPACHDVCRMHVSTFEDLVGGKINVADALAAAGDNGQSPARAASNGSQNNGYSNDCKRSSNNCSSRVSEVLDQVVSMAIAS